MNCNDKQLKIFNKVFKIDEEVKLCPLPNCKLRLTNFLENGTFLVTDDKLHFELMTNGYFGSRYKAQFNVQLDDKIIKKGESVWALSAEELLYLVCECQMFKIVKDTAILTEDEAEYYKKDELYQEISNRNITTVYRYAVYCEFRKMGLIVRNDNNYGGLYTIYKGNPGKHHASAIVYGEFDDILDQSAMLRLGNVVNKACIIAKPISSLNTTDMLSDFEKVKVQLTLYTKEKPEGLASFF